MLLEGCQPSSEDRAYSLPTRPAALGLDPGIGFLHVDTPNRDSLACDLMEVARADVDAFLIDWKTRENAQA
jgi:CRISPR/Cas system-associated endonuclease Cas1